MLNGEQCFRLSRCVKLSLLSYSFPYFICVQFRILRQKGTEPAGTGEYEHHKAAGVYECAGCGTPLYKSTTKFSSGCGWPAFFDGEHTYSWLCAM